jgi:hypothetical protein
MATAVEDQVSKLATEIRELQKKRGDVEYRLRGLENKEKFQQQGGAPLLGKRGRPGDNIVASKRFREGERETRTGDFRGRLDEGRGRERDDRADNRPGRIASVAVGVRRDSRDSRDPRDSRESRDSWVNPRDHSRDSRDVGRSREESRRPQLSSTIGDAPHGSEKRPSLDTNNEETKRRSKNLFNRALMGTLKQFKTESESKSEAEQRRMDVEQKIQQKVKDEAERSVEEQKRAFQEQKEKELALREEVVQQLEQKALELLNLKWDHHRDQLAPFLKTETKPPIYYKLAKPEPKKDTKEESKQTNSTQENRSQ